MVKKTIFFFACFPFLHMALDGVAGGGGVRVRSLPWLFYLDLSMNGMHVALKTRVHVAFLGGIWCFHFCPPPPLCFFRNEILTRVHLKFSSCRTSRVACEPSCWGYYLLYFPSTQETTTENVLYPRCRSLNTLLASVVFGYL